MDFPEKLLHFIWRFSAFDALNLQSHCGKRIEILHPGTYNTDSGPDFIYAKIRLDGILLAGDVEIHKRSVDWCTHKHHKDKAFESVILHIIWGDYLPIYYQDRKEIPTLSIGSHCNTVMLNLYKQWQSTTTLIPCQNNLTTVSKIYKIQLLDTLGHERLEKKKQEIFDLAIRVGWNWERLTFINLCKSFGMSTNKMTFERFGELFSCKLLHKYAGQKNIIEALIFGQAGMIQELDTPDLYTQTLVDEYRYQSRLHGLKNSISVHEWKFMRMRPQNFPTVRLAQLSALLAVVPEWFSRLFTAKNPSDILDLIAKVKANTYWHNHYRFSVESKSKSSGKLNRYFGEHLLINAFIPIIYAFGKYMKLEDFEEKAIRWLSEIRVEKNSVVNLYQKLGFPLDSAFDSQAILHLKNQYRDQKRCLDCSVGAQVLRKGSKIELSSASNR